MCLAFGSNECCTEIKVSSGISVKMGKCVAMPLLVDKLYKFKVLFL